MITLADIKKTVEEHKDEALQCLAEAVQSPSPTGSELPMAKTMLKWLDKLDLEVNTYEYMKDRPNIIATWKGSDPEFKSFLFNGHMDVFPPSETDDPNYNPWSGEIKGDKLYGRGSSDMKGGDCAALMAVKLLQEMGFEPKGDITLNYVSDEETGGEYGVLSLLKDGLLKGDIGISMEPSEMEVILGHGAVYPCKIIVYGDGGHAGMPLKKEEIKYGGEDAIKKAMKAVAALHKLQEEVISKKKAPFGQSNLAVTMVHAGHTTNNWARVAEIIIDRRYMSNETPEEVNKEICDALDEIKKTDPYFTYEFHDHYEPVTPVLDIPEDSEIVQVIDEVAEGLMGVKPKHTHTIAGDDAAHIADAIGTVMARIGPGSDDFVATPGEYVLIENYLNCIAIYMATLVKMMA